MYALVMSERGLVYWICICSCLASAAPRNQLYKNEASITKDDGNSPTLYTR